MQCTVCASFEVLKMLLQRFLVPQCVHAKIKTMIPSVAILLQAGALRVGFQLLQMGSSKHIVL